MSTTITKIAVVIIVCILVAPYCARAQTTNDHVRVRLETGGAKGLRGWQAKDLGVGIHNRLETEWAPHPRLGVLASGGHIAFFRGAHPEGYKPLRNASATAMGLGLRVHFITSDEKYGDLWIDGHLNYVRTGHLNRIGADGGIGYDFSLLNGIQAGPFARYTWIWQPASQNDRDSQDAMIASVGISISMRFPLPRPPIQQPAQSTDAPRHTANLDPDPTTEEACLSDDDCAADEDAQSPDETEEDATDETQENTPFVKVDGRQILGGEFIYFDWNSARVRRRSHQYLDLLVNLLVSHPEYVRISIEGHTDRTGPAWFNDKLSLERAKRVKRYLVKHGVDNERLEVVGHGQRDIRVDTHNWEQRGQNRRVEFYILELDPSRARPVIEKKPADTSNTSRPTEQRGTDNASSVEPTDAETDSVYKEEMFNHAH